ncbi:MAG: NrdH-redoxin [Candidatus Diapherotrites archaeon]|uniref:NrdH-redoxin n=1 Tax=Candidatus Iainarchaeum sp. TaxID=3101447 RepID=A0A2D6M192_9ARCH|nr:NrdH-redoxin [Candidatus Diapherotrites archaeon]|tara:strand:+ start:2992 stop:3252 length:261 start_codon:yes stop_codon:yes gene_type:complete
MGAIVYSIPNCAKCRAAKALLKRLGVEYEEFDVMADKEKAKEMVEKRRAVRTEDSKEVSLPVLDINGIIVEGFDRAKIEEAVKNTT